MKFEINELVKSTGATVLKNTAKSEALFEISTDTRTIKNGDFYLPLKGESFDGEKFVEKALQNGAKGYFTTKAEAFDSADIVLKVEDTKIAYLKLANFIREKFNPKVVMITGSSGKTTTKEMTYSVLNEKFKTHKTALNHNNEIGFCQTVLEMSEDTEVLIIETGMRGLGEIELVARYARPDIPIIANIGTAHIGRSGSRENIEKANCEIVKYLDKDGILIAHCDDLIKNEVRRCECKKVYFSLDDVKFEEKEVGYTKFIYGKEEYELAVEGDYNVQNSLASINTGLMLGMKTEEIRKGLLKYSPIEKRWEMEKIGGYNLINDSYNANPESMKASIATFLELYSKNKSRRLLVLGDIGELGEDEGKYHEEIGDFIGKNFSKTENIKLITVGKLAKNISKIALNKGIWAKNFENNDGTSRYILENIEFGTTIFLKASRSMKFEEIITKLKQQIKEKSL